ncbi:UDP-N-acetylmuramoyl-tripeptide--D-alanyl-D-alanine ligase [Lichenicola sp.]|uniref:UDP-N-acetylmuramoyl-tripeptide--D-alanyl-D- alanine ligase n=1 Tax=Lichenicola sp. TaxID=2804529 RepID=UPI003B0071F2
MSVLWTGEALARAVDGRFGGPPPAGITGISIDTRTLAPGDLFVALVGDSGDGHLHVEAALAAGAAAALVHRTDTLPEALRDDTRLLHVADTFAALNALGRAGRARFQGRVVAVTGSVGKTTTKEMLRIALSALGPTHASHASYNNHWGVPLTLARLPENAAFCVSEIGMNHPGEIAPLAALARPDVAVITTIASSHIGHMGSLEAIALEKGSLFGALSPGGIAIFPAEAPHADLLADIAVAAQARSIRFGTGVDAEARLTDLALASDGSTATIVLGGAATPLRLASPGRHMAMNALACLAAVAALGGDIAVAAKALSGFVAGDGRGALRPLAGGTAALLDESYNASGASVRAALSVLALLPAQRRVAVLGDMLELGTFARAEHESLNQSVRESADIVYCSGDMMKFLYDSLPETMRGGYSADARSLAPQVVSALRPGDVVLVKGSYGSRMRDVVSALIAHQAAAAA